MYIFLYWIFYTLFLKLEYKNVHELIFLSLYFYFFFNINTELVSRILRVQICQSDWLCIGIVSWYPLYSSHSLVCQINFLLCNVFRCPIYLCLCSLFRSLYVDSNECVFCIVRVTMHRHRPLVLSVFTLYHNYVSIYRQYKCFVTVQLYQQVLYCTSSSFHDSFSFTQL